MHAIRSASRTVAADRVPCHSNRCSAGLLREGSLPARKLLGTQTGRFLSVDVSCAPSYAWNHPQAAAPTARGPTRDRRCKRPPLAIEERSSELAGGLVNQ